ncbi:MarR family winged helix-turn-helix transcriptional regulator [Nonomuraea longicatena]|uniref:HTH marR-type domain-containing protein n=1 Tax=Nonomuraea longicatena TaxID=83682 RepID=A0ABN1Q2F9_9ACTN
MSGTFLGSENHLTGLLTLTSRLVQDRLTAALRPLGLTYAQAAALVRLWRTPGGRMRQLDFVSSLALTRPTGTLLIGDLERAGLLVRSADPDDGRRQLITLTDAGRKLEPEVHAVLADLHHRLEAAVGEEDLVKTTQALTRALAYLDPAALAPAPAGRRGAGAGTAG